MSGTIQVGNTKNPYYNLAYETPTISVGVESTNIIICTVTFKKPNKEVVSRRVNAKWYLSDNVNGDGLTATAPNLGVTAGATGTVIENISDKSGICVSDSSGICKFSISDNGTPTFYLVICNPDGTITVSGAITFS